MDNLRQKQTDLLLIAGAKQLDLTPTQYKRAVEHYEAVGEYLAKDDSLLADYSPTISPQGSIAIGTATKPIGVEEFDLDMMCVLLMTNNVDPAEVKRLLGKRLSEHETYKNMLVEKNRCWRLVYAGEFHMDIIPGIPDLHVRAATSLLVPDKAMQCWKETDPKGYAAWFTERAVTAALAQNRISAGVEPAPPPDEQQKLPLQILVQLLKRHRDIMFGDDKNAPISIIITTLAARAYNGSASVFAALSDVLRIMPLHIKRTENGDPLVENPVNPHENFADKWAIHPERERCFHEWIKKAQLDLNRVEATFLSDMEEPLATWVGHRAARGALKAYGETIQSKRATGLAISASTGILASKSVKATDSPKHTFFGI